MIMVVGFNVNVDYLSGTTYTSSGSLSVDQWVTYNGVER